jgi:hypothetical protein
VQARLQARHGERLQEADWRALEAAQSLDQYIERARATALRRFTDAVNPRMSSQTIERALRAAWRGYVAEIAGWVPAEWQAAVLWAAYVPELPAIDAISRGESPAWIRQDPLLSGLNENADLAPLTRAEGVPGWRWAAHWQSLWPKGKSDARLLAGLSDAVQAHVAQLAQTGPQETSQRYRGDLARLVTRMFRRHGGTPLAVFSHLVLMALDLERLRGGLVRRRLFHPGHSNPDHARQAA